jgi:serine protease SohB
LEFLTDYGLFLAKIVTVLVAVMVFVAIVATASSKLRKAEKKGHIEIDKLNAHYDEMKDAMHQFLLPEGDLKKYLKEKKKADKEKKKSDNENRRRIFVIDFHGDIRASQTVQLEHCISCILTVATPDDEVVIRLESAGGMVHGYGLAASQLVRITDRDIPLTVCIDKVAASGGYMMACIGQKILAAPFSVIGSIGVLAQVPNFHRLLKKHDIDYEMITAGEYKRTLTMFGENTEKGREKFTEEIQETHELFKQFVTENRRQLNMDEVATGEVWFGKRALELGLVDEIRTAEDYLLASSSNADIFHLEYVEKRSFPEKLGMAAQSAIGRSVDALISKNDEMRYFN